MRGNWSLGRVWLLLGLLTCASLAIAGERRDIVFDCPCSAEFVAGTEGESGTLRLIGGVRSLRAVESGELRLSARRWDERNGGSTGRLSAKGHQRNEWSIAFEKPESGAVIEVRLLEETGRDADGFVLSQEHEVLALWPVARDGSSNAVRFVDILTDSDGDGIGDVNERLAGTSVDDPRSRPGETVVDLLALYTAEYADGESGFPYTRLLHTISVASAFFEDSGTNLRLRLVGMREEELDQSGWVNDEVRKELMDSYGADVSVQFGESGPCPRGAGCAGGLGASRRSYWRDGTAWDGNASAWVTAHELGHVMGLAHSARQGETGGAWRWSRGHYVTPLGEVEVRRRGTIMSYGERVFGGMFSDPSADCGVGPCGVAAGELDGADSVTTLDRLRFQVGAHREPAADSDGDGIVDAADAFPNDAQDWFDIDGDGIGDNADPDNDNDGTPDVDDPFPIDPDEWADADLDGIGDNADDDVQDLSPFRDPALRAAVEEALGKASGGPINAEELASLSELRATGRDIRDLTGLEQATGLVKLDLGRNRIEDLNPLSGMTDLEDLDLPDNAVADLSPLAELTDLKRLNVNDNAVADLSPLAGLHNLWLLQLDRNPVDDISPLADLSSLSCLFLSHTGVAFADVVALPRFARFRCLGISGLGVADLSPLSGLDDLVHLFVSDNAISDLEPLANLLGLELLHIEGNDVSDLGPLADLVKLERLHLDGNGISNLKPLAKLVELTQLNLEDNDISDLAPLANLVKLERLYLNSNAVSDLEPLINLVGLERLFLDGNQVSSLSPLSAMTGMQWLDLDSNAIADLEPLANLAELERLDLRSNGISDLGSLANLVDLKELNLDDNSISDLGPLEDLVELDYLQFNHNSVSDLGPLANLIGLRWLSLQGNRVSGLSPLAAMTGMRVLRLDTNAIVDIGPIVKRSVFGGDGSGGAYLTIDGNPLNDTSIDEHIPTLQSWGVNVFWLRRGSGIEPAAVTDPTLRALVAEAMASGLVHVDDDASTWPIDKLRRLRVSGRGIASLSGLEVAMNLERLYASSNRIADLSSLAELANLRSLDLRNNRVSDISPLVANTDLGEDDWVALDGNPLSQESLNTHVPALLDRGVKVSVDTVALSVVAGEAGAHYDVSGYFRALLGENPTLAASSGDTSLASVAVAGGAVTVTPGARAGTVTVTVEAMSGSGRTARLEFLVRVRGPWLVPLVPSASGSRQGFVRVSNHDDRAGEVRIQPVDDAGQAGGELTLSIGAGQTVHFNSDDLESGNPSKGLSGSAGDGQGDWRLALRSDLDLEVLAYIRTRDGFLTSVHDVATRTADGHEVPTFNPASNYNQRSLLRISNLGGEDAEVTIRGVDDAGASPGTHVNVQVRAGTSLLLTADDLEKGGSGLTGALGDGQGKWRLTVRSAGELSVMSLMASPGGHLTNLSTGAPTALEADGVHTVPLFPSASDALGRQGFVRVVNLSDVAGDVRIVAHDDTGLAYDALTLALEAGRTAHFNSDDLELGSPAKGLTGSTGAGRGDWRLELSSELDLDVLAYVRTPSGFLTSMHDVVRSAGRRHDVATFNPGSNWRQESKLRIVNPGTRPAHVTIGGVDDGAMTPGDVVRLTVPVGAAMTVTAPQLEDGDEAFHDRQRASLGDGRGKWRLLVDSEQPIFLVNVLASPTGHLTNLSTSPNR